MTKDNYLIVDSPFQLICGIEYILNHDIKLIKLIIVNNRIDNKKHLSQINEIFYSFKSLFISKKTYNINTSGYLTFYLFISKFKEIINDISKASKGGLLIIGDYGNCYFRHLSNMVESSKIIILDDGFRTIETIANISSNSLGLKEYAKILLSLFSYKPFYSQEVILFTIFYNYVDFKNKYENKFTELRRDINKIPLKNELHFIGVALVEAKIISMATYIKYLKKFCNKYSKTNKIVYIPHRREDVKNVKYISEKLNLQVREIDKTIEIFEVNNVYLPKHITSFFSTALISLNKLLLNKVSISYIRLKDSEILSRKKDINDVYNILNKEIKEEVLGDV